MARIKSLAGDECGPGTAARDCTPRAGPHGERFAGGDGLTLARLKSAEHGIDLGPLMPGRLPGILRTAGKRIRLLHPLIEADVARACGSASASKTPRACC